MALRTRAPTPSDCSGAVKSLSMVLAMVVVVVVVVVDMCLCSIVFFEDNDQIITMCGG